MIPKLEQASAVAYSSKETIKSTYDLALEMLSVEGCFVECGVGAGAQLMAMKLAASGTEKIIYGFDSFEGIPLAGRFDTSQPGIGDITHDQNLPLKERLVSSGITCHSQKNVSDTFKQFEIDTTGIVFIEGWFSETLPVKKTGKISLLRLDGDLYESTLVCLEYLYPLVSLGGVIIIDDFHLDGARQAVQDYFKGTFPPMIYPVNAVPYFYKIKEK